MSDYSIALSYGASTSKKINYSLTEGKLVDFGRPLFEIPLLRLLKPYNDTKLFDFNSIMNQKGPVTATNKENVRFTEITTLLNPQYKLLNPIKVELIYSDGEVIGDIAELELYSYGANSFEVLKELKDELVELFEDLISIDNNELGKHPLQWKKILKEYINKND